MKRLALTLVLGALASVAFAETIVPADYDNRAVMRFANYSGSETLTNFPVLVQLIDGASPVSRDDFESDDWSDLRFTTADGTTTVPYEVEKWFDPPPTAVSPTNLTGCVFWLDAGYGTLTNAAGGVTNWIDRSGTGNDFILSTNGAPTLVANVINGQPVLRFDGTDKLVLTNTVSMPTSVWNIFIVQKTTVVTNSFIFNIDSATPGRVSSHLPWGDGQVYWDCGGDSGDARLHVAGLTTTKFSLWNFVSDDGSPNRQEIWQDGVKKASDGSATTVNANSKEMELGGSYGRYIKSDIAEIIIYNRAMSVDEKNAVLAYFNAKYDLDITYRNVSEADIWVQVPELNPNTEMYVYWGNSAAVDIPSYTTNGAVWDTNYKAVWHLSERNGSISPDSTANGWDGTINDTNSIVNTPARISNGENFPGGSSKKITRLLTESNWPEYTVIMWVKPSVLNQPGYTALFNNDAANNNDFQIEADENKYQYRGGQYFQIIANGEQTTTWNQIAVTCRAGTPLIRTFYNGNFKSSNASEDATFGQIEIGCNRAEDKAFNGMIDEFRISSVVRSDDWIKACYQSQNKPQEFVQIEKDIYWDSDTVPGLQNGNGRWSTTNALWSSTTNGSASLLNWNNGYIANFIPSGGSVITVDAISAQGMVVDGSGYTFSGGEIKLGSSGFVANEGVTLKSKVTLDTRQTWYVGAGKTIGIPHDTAGLLAGSGTLVKTGPGTLLVNSKWNTMSGGIIVNGGTLADLTADALFSTGGRQITINSNATLETSTHTLTDGINLNRLPRITINEGGTWKLRREQYVKNDYLKLKGGTINVLANDLRVKYNPVINVYPSPITARIIGNQLTLYNNLVFNTGIGSAPVSLLVSAKVTQAAGGWRLTKNGLGSVKLTGNNTYSGGTVINAGTLLVSNTAGSGTGSGTVTVSGGTLAGTGYISKTVSVSNGGTIDPGEPTGNLTITAGNLTFAATGATNSFRVDLASPTDYGSLTVAGSGSQITLTNVTLNVNLSYEALGREKYFLIVNNSTNSISGQFNGLPQGEKVDIGSPFTSRISYEGDADSGTLAGGNDVVLYFEPSGLFFLVR